jgi:hypothetical protein
LPPRTTNSRIGRGGTSALLTATTGPKLDVDAIGFGDEPEQVAVAVEGPLAERCGEFDGRLGVAVDEAVPQSAGS